jgi:hypothetical protein
MDTVRTVCEDILSLKGRGIFWIYSKIAMNTGVANADDINQSVLDELKIGAPCYKVKRCFDFVAKNPETLETLHNLLRRASKRPQGNVGCVSFDRVLSYFKVEPSKLCALLTRLPDTSLINDRDAVELWKIIREAGKTFSTLSAEDQKKCNFQDTEFIRGPSGKFNVCSL